jgi:hypothetical protein
MTNYASGIKASDLSLVGMPSPSGEPRKAPELRLVESPAPSGGAEAAEGGTAALAVAPPISAPEQGAPGVTNHPPTELSLIAEAELCIELKPIPETTTWGEDPALRKASAMPRKAPPPIAAEPEDENRRSSTTGDNRKKLTVVAAVLGCLVITAGLVVALRSESAPAPQLAAAKPAAPAADPAAAPAPAAAAPVPVAAAPAPPSEASSSPTNSPTATDQGPAFGDFAGRLQVLKNAGNWNVFVIYAAEWARKQPGNPDAWRELSFGYLKLRQFRDALDAAKKAVELAPGSFLAWQSLGKVNLGLQESSAALAAFERAAALNDQDVVSLVQAGMLDARLGRLPEARIAFAKALASSPEDIDALCGAAAVAQKEGRPKEAEAMALKLKSLDGICRDSGSESVQVPANATAGSRAASSAAR